MRITLDRKPNLTIDEKLIQFKEEVERMFDSLEIAGSGEGTPGRPGPPGPPGPPGEGSAIPIEDLENILF